MTTVLMTTAKPLTAERIEDIRGNVNGIYDNRVAERDVAALLGEVERLRKAIERGPVLGMRPQYTREEVQSVFANWSDRVLER